jgi:hypothetical protein
MGTYLAGKQIIQGELCVWTGAGLFVPSTVAAPGFFLTPIRFNCGGSQCMVYGPYIQLFVAVHTCNVTKFNIVSKLQQL